MKTIKLTQGKEAIVDDEDYEYLNQWKWFYGKVGYAIRSRIKGEKTNYMHRIIMNSPKDMEIDHIDHDKLNNQKYNLRIVTRSQNTMNHPKRNTGKSKYKGVSFYKRNKTNSWTAQIKLNYKKIHLGYFKTDIEAAKAYNKAAITYFGEFADLNEIKEEKE